MRLAVLYWSRGDFRVETRPSCPFSNLIVLFWFFVSASSVSWESLKRIRLRLGRSPIPNDYHVSADPAQCWLRNGCWTLPAKRIDARGCQCSCQAAEPVRELPAGSSCGCLVGNRLWSLFDGPSLIRHMTRRLEQSLMIILQNIVCSPPCLPPMMQARKTASTWPMHDARLR